MRETKKQSELCHVKLSFSLVLAENSKGTIHLVQTQNFPRN